MRDSGFRRNDGKLNHLNCNATARSGKVAVRKLGQLNGWLTRTQFVIARSEATWRSRSRVAFFAPTGLPRFARNDGSNETGYA